MASQLNQIDFDYSQVEKSTILFVEDEDVLREEISNLFKDFFKGVLVASDGKEGLDLYLNNRENIDIIMTDINMPNMNGIDFISKVRETDNKVPVLICTAFNEADSLMKLFKLNISDYIAKPIQMITTIKICNKILTNINNERLVQKHLKELEDLKMVLEDENFIIETTLDGEIIYVNDLICNVSGYTKEELIGQKNSLLKHPDTSKEFSKSLWETLSSGKKWKGKIKNQTKDGDPFYVKTTILPIFDENQKPLKFLSTGYLITEQEEEKQQLKRLILKHKGEKIKIEQDVQRRVNEEVQNSLAQFSNEKNIEKQKLINLVQELDAEIKKLRNKQYDYTSRVLTLENQLKDSTNRFDNMQMGYQKRVSTLNNTATLLAKKCEDLIKKNKIYKEKLEKSQDSIKVLQTYIDEYREKIKNLEDVIASLEKDLKEKKG